MKLLPCPIGRLAAVVSALPILAAASSAQSGAPSPCKVQALQVHSSCTLGAHGDYWLRRAKCNDLLDAGDRLECLQDAFAELQDALEECGEQRAARVELCEALGGGRYAPAIDPEDFVPVIDNPYLPFLPGTTYVYEKDDGQEIETTTVIVTHETKEILGVTCTVVHDIVTVDDEVQEDTFDWFAQDVHGNVWYFGELSFEYEDGEIAGVEGSWEAGEDGALPGIVMLASPAIGDVYRQEFLLGEAEDAGLVVSLSSAATVPWGSFQSCLETEDFSPLEPGHSEHKFYAPGVGLVLEVSLSSGNRNELVEIEFP